MVGAVDLADAEWRLALRTWNTHLALIIHAVGGIWFVLVRKGVTVARHLLDRVVAGDVPETAVLLVPRPGQRLRRSALTSRSFRLNSSEW